ncbi:MAG: ABC transporter permease [Chloroflexi bacterium]|nr:ABC transporter permease [Chloroflexota bacterium]
MFRFIVRRLISMVPTLFGVTLIVFLFVHLIPGDPAAAMLRENAPKELAARIREQLGLNKPWFINIGEVNCPLTAGKTATTDGGLFMTYHNCEGLSTVAALRYWQFKLDDPFDSQYLLYLSKLLRGDLGQSLVTKNPVADDLKLKFPATIELSIMALLVAVVIGILTGIISAAKQNTPIDTTSMFISLAGVSIPIYWLGMMGILVFAVWLHWVPSGARLGNDTEIQRITNLYVLDSLLTFNGNALGDALKHVILPALVLATVPMSILARMTRATMLDVLNQDYIRTAEAKGLAKIVIVARHALPNAMLPIITVIGLQVGGLLSGAILTETIFSWPGIGRWVFESIQLRDYPVIQNVILVIALLFVLINLLVDLSYAAIDPRIRYS